MGGAESHSSRGGSCAITHHRPAWRNWAKSDRLSPPYWSRGYLDSRKAGRTLDGQPLLGFYASHGSSLKPFKAAIRRHIRDHADGRPLQFYLWFREAPAYFPTCWTFPRRTYLRMYWKRGY